MRPWGQEKLFWCNSFYLIFRGQTDLFSLEEKPFPVPGWEMEELIPSPAAESPEVTARELMDLEFLFFTRIPFRALGLLLVLTIW